MCKIRTYEEKDYKRVEEICLGTSAAGEEAEGELGKNPVPEKEEDPQAAMMAQYMPGALLDTFCHYYIEKEPEHCYVAVDEADAAVGYILCSKDFDSWESTFTSRYVETSANPITKMMGPGTIEGLRPFAKEYPAHLHIDIDAGYQRRGLGSKMMDVLLTHLREEGVPGVMLCVAPDNEKGMNFYQKYGFTVLAKGEQEIAMGIKL